MHTRTTPPTHTHEIPVTRWRPLSANPTNSTVAPRSSAAQNINNITFPDNLFFRKTRRFSFRSSVPARATDPAVEIFRNPKWGGEAAARVPLPPANCGRRPKFLRVPPCRSRTYRSAASIFVVPLSRRPDGHHPPTTITRGVGRRPPRTRPDASAADKTAVAVGERMFDRAPRSHCNTAAVAARRPPPALRPRAQRAGATFRQFSAPGVVPTVVK